MKRQTTQRRMMRMIVQTERQVDTSYAAVQITSASDVTADAEPHDPYSEQGDDTTEHNNQDLNDQEESSHDADSNPCFDEIPEANPEDELEPWVDYAKTTTHNADDLLTVNRITSWILRQR